jgi:hypothetical protein
VAAASRGTCALLSLLQLPWSTWARDATSDLNSLPSGSPVQRLRATVQPASHVLLLVADAAIAPLLKRYPFLHEKTLVHCSGALSLPGVAGAHPLMTFGHQLYTLEQYQQVPFMVDSGQDFARLLPGLPNAISVRLEDKPLSRPASWPEISASCGRHSNDSSKWAAAATLEPYLTQSCTISS